MPTWGDIFWNFNHHKCAPVSSSKNPTAQYAVWMMLRVKQMQTGQQAGRKRDGAAEFVRNRSSRKSADSDSVVFNTQLDVSSLFVTLLFSVADSWTDKSTRVAHRAAVRHIFWLPPFDKRCSLQVDGPPKSAQVEPASYHRKCKWRSVRTNSQSSLWNYFKKIKVHCKLPCKASKW